MRLFLILDGHGAEFIDLIQTLKDNAHEIIYWVGDRNEGARKFPEIVFHHCYDAQKGIPAAGVDIFEFAPPGADLIQKMHETESLVMDLLNKKRGYKSISACKRLYHEMLRYWYGVLKRYKPDAIIFAISPAFAYNFIIYELARLLNIKTIMFSDTWVSDRTLAHADIWDYGKALQKEIHSNKGKNFSAEDLSDDLREYYLSYGNVHCRADVPYMKILKDKYSGFNLFLNKLNIIKNNFKTGRLCQVIISAIAKRTGENFVKEYKKFQIKPDLGKKFIYVPLQLQPERATCPLGGVFDDQILMIEILSASLPDGWAIYVKEHPAQRWKNGINYSDYRYPGYYKKIAALKNVFLIPIETDNYDLIHSSQAVSTVTGTLGWQAVLHSKPALIFGYPWYQDCPVLFRVNSVESCVVALEKINEGFRIEQKDVINYLKSFDNATIHCCVDEIGGNTYAYIFKLSIREKINNFTQAVLNELK